MLTILRLRIEMYTILENTTVDIVEQKEFPSFKSGEVAL